MTCDWNRYQCSECAEAASELGKKELVLHSCLETETFFSIKKPSLFSKQV